MKKPNFSSLTGKLKSGVAEASGKAKEMADGIAAAAQEKPVKKPDVFVKKAKCVIKEKRPMKAKHKETLDDALRMAVEQYNDAYTILNDNGATLYRERTRAVDLIMHIEDLVNSIANRPKTFDTEITETKVQRESFVGACEFAKAELEAAKKSALGAGAGTAAGAAIVSVAPTAAMWVATTFGTASTGTAISALSGAAATNAALAWLGGGALAAGGGGMAAGQAFLVLAGPVGWGIAGATVLSSVVLFHVNRMKLEKKKKEEIDAVKNNTNTARKTAAQVQKLLDEVIALRENLIRQYNACLSEYGKDFLSIPNEQQIQLGALVNNTKALAASLGKSIQ